MTVLPFLAIFSFGCALERLCSNIQGFNGPDTWFHDICMSKHDGKYNVCPERQEVGSILLSKHKEGLVLNVPLYHPNAF